VNRHSIVVQAKKLFSQATSYLTLQLKEQICLAHFSTGIRWNGIPGVLLLYIIDKKLTGVNIYDDEELVQLLISWNIWPLKSPDCTYIKYGLQRVQTALI